MITLRSCDSTCLPIEPGPAANPMISRSLIQVLIILAVVGMTWSQDSSSVFETPASANPLLNYIQEMDEAGRILSGWGQKDSTHDSWLFASYAMLASRDQGTDGNEPFPGLVTLIPSMWSDLKYLTPNYLIELAGGALSSQGLMRLSGTEALEDMQVEERFIRHIAGFSHLRMLQGSIGDSLYKRIISDCVRQAHDAQMVNSALLQAIEKHCGLELSKQFEAILDGRQWIDVELHHKAVGSDSLRFSRSYRNDLVFPCDLRIVGTRGDTLSIRSTQVDEGIVLARKDIKEVQLDPGHILSEYYRHNNVWPRSTNRTHIQPFFALPDWESYRVVVSPSAWSDWDGDRRYGLKISSGYGIDLWPAYPSDFRHRMTLELNTHGQIDDQSTWGSRFSYANPLSLSHRLFSNFSFHTYDDWQGLSMGFTKYFGPQTFLIEGSKIIYQRIGLAYEHDNYGDPAVWDKNQDVDLIRAAYTGLSLTRYGDRMYLQLRAARGMGPEGGFNILKTQIDLSGVVWDWLVGGLHFVGGSQSRLTPGPYQFTHSYAWQDALSALPIFRGQTKIETSTNNYLGLSVSGGYWLSWIQVKLFGSSMIYDNGSGPFFGIPPHYAAGFGFEHKSIFTAGLYFPVWQSVPIEGEDEWKWRYQWRFSWNL